MTAQLAVGPHESSSLIRSDSNFQTGKITLNGDLGEALEILNGSSFVSDGSGQFQSLGVTGQITANNLVIIDDNNTIKIGSPTFTTNKVFPELGTTTWNNDLGITFSNDTVIPDAINMIEQWKYSYLVDTPPPVILGTTLNDADKLNVTWSFHPTIDVGFSDINLPHHISVYFDLVKSSLNLSQDFSDPSTITVDTGSRDTDELNIFLDSGTSTLVGTVYNYYGDLDTETEYDVRLYLKNYNETKDIKYVNIFNFLTGEVGVPTAPLNGSTNTISETEIFVDWDKPLDHNDLEPGNNEQPFIQQYNVTYIASTSVRYGGVNSDSGGVSTTPIVGDNSLSEISLNTLVSPGTTYSLTVKAVNTKNVGEGPQLSLSGFTDYPSQPQTIDNLSLTFDPSVYSPFTIGGYTLDGGQFFNQIVNYNNLDGTLDNQELQLSTTTDIFLNEVIADSSTSPLAIMTLFGGIQGSVSGSGKNLFPFGGANSDGLYVNGDITLGITNDGDAYSSSGTGYQGFWRSAQFYGKGDHTTLFKPTSDIYEFYFLLITNPSSTNLTSQSLVFAMDDINISPTLNNSGIFGIEGNDSNMISYNSGVPTYNNTVIFDYRTTISEIGNNYLRGDLEHVEVQISDDTTEIGTTSTIKQSDIGTTHKYFEEPISSWDISPTLHNTSGLVLEDVDDLNPRVNIQFNTFTIDMTGVDSNYYTDDLKIKLTGKNLYGSSSPVYENYRDLTGVSQPLRIDFISLNKNNSGSLTTTTNGKRVNSGDTEFPLTEGVDFGIDYDDTKNILSDTGYTEELQLVNGLYHTPSNSNSFLDYSNYFYPTVLSITTPDYSSVSLTGYRYVTFKYTRTFTGFKNKIQLTLVNQTGLTVDFSIINGANHKIFIKLEDTRTLSPGDYSYTTPWLSACDAFGIMGVNNAVDGDGCLVTKNSTLTSRECLFNPFLEDVNIYVKVGLDVSEDHSIENVSLTIL